MANIIIKISVVASLLISKYLAIGSIVPKLLLPFHGDYQVNYSINAEDGCYQWKSLREDVASIAPLEETFDSVNMCSRSAIVVVRSTHPSRKTTLILATNVKTGTIFQCDVIVDKIDVIDIVSRTRELYLADPPEELNIRALDQEGNTFSSTAGMVFEWSLAQDDGSTVSKRDVEKPVVSAHNILHIQRFLDTIYNPEPYVDELEKNGKMSDSILVSGAQTGTAVVVAKLISTIACHGAVKPASVRFVVRDKVILNPASDVYLLRHAVMRYQVERWRQGKATEIEMPSSQYILNVRQISEISPEVIKLDQQTSVITGLNGGHSQVYLIDQHLKHYDDTLMEQATSDVYVVEAAYLRFEIEPHNKWILEVDKNYIITVHIYSEDNKKIYPVDNVRIVESLNEEYLEVLDSVKNGTWFHVRTSKIGACEISSLLKGVVKVGKQIVEAGMFVKGSENLDIFENPITTSQDLEIFNEVTVSPSVILFPWQPELVQYKFRFLASGGSGNYTWSVNETDSSNISYTGVIIVQSGGDEENSPRTVKVKATDIKNSFHYGEASVIVAPPANIQFALSTLEAEVDTILNLYVSMYAKIDNNLVAFTDCSNTKNLQWSIHDTSVFEFSGELKQVSSDFEDPFPLSSPCLMREVRALKEGHTTVSLSYYHTLLNETLQASTVIASFNPLKVIDPARVAVVSLDSTKNLIFQGGPNPWPLLPNNHEKLIASDENNIDLHQKVSAKEHVFIAHCTQIGGSVVTLTVQNKPCTTNPYPKKSKVDVQISCTIPVSVKLTAEYLPESCPLFQNQNSESVVLAGDTFQAKLTAYDSYGNEFDNFTSLSVDWRLSPDADLIPLVTKSLYLPDSNHQMKHHLLHDLLIPSQLGDNSLKVTIEKYSDAVKYSICSPHQCKISPPIEASIILVIVGPVTLSPSLLMLFNRPDYRGVLKISGGSGYFNHQLVTDSGSPSSIVKVTGNGYDSERTLTLHPVAVGRAAMTVSDICITKATAVEGALPRTEITVSDVSSLLLTTTSLLEVGSSTKATIQLDMKELSMPDAFNLNIKLTAEPEGIITLGPPEKDGQKLAYRASINAVDIGTVSIRASTFSRDGHLISSNTVKLVVFSPLKLFPPRITVIRGAEFHLNVEGGPPDDVQYHFDVEDTEVATASSSGVLTALKIGNTSVRARATTKDGKVFHSVSASLVHVVQIKGVWIDIPTSRFQTGTTIPVHVYGSAGPGYDSVSLDSDAAGLLFSWKVHNHAVVNIHSVHSHSGIEIPDTLKFTMLLNGTGPGQSSVSVSVSATHSSLGQLAEPFLKAEIQVSVFDPLAVLNGLKKVWNTANSLLLTPDTTYNVLTNRDGLALKLDYFNLHKSCSLNMSVQENGCITVNNEQKSLITGDHPCQTTLLVTATEHFNAVQTLAIHVKVKLVSYVIAVVKNKFYVKSDNALSGFPLGSQLTVEVQQFDNFGSRFDRARPEIMYNANRNDVLEITQNQMNHLFNINAPRSGVTIFKVWSGKDTAYIFPINIISTIAGEGSTNSLTVGLKECFESKLVDSEGNPGKWHMKKPHSFAVQSSTGAVMPLSKSTADLEFTLESVLSKLHLSSDSFWVKFDEEHLPEFITNAKSHYIIPISLSDEKHGSCEGLDDKMREFAESTFECKGFLLNTAEQLSIFNVRPTYISDIESYACVLDLIEHDSSTKERISVFVASFTLSLAINPEAASRGISLQTAVNTPFIPAFKLINDTQIILTEFESSSLCLSATIEVHRSLDFTTDSRFIEIKTPQQFVNGITCYELIYPESSDKKLSDSKYGVKIFSTLTKQEEYVGIDIQQSSIAIRSGTIQQCSDLQQPSDSWVADQYSQTYLGFITAMLVIILTTLIILLTCGFFKWAFSDPRHTPSDSSPPSSHRSPPRLQPYSPSRPILFNRFSPTNRGSPPSHSNSSSPGRPQLWSTYYEPQRAT